mmetsp:Transcript_25958/g.65302  ORF Transcript_25958/g.65302 Transcript_25958/m.65302 type:complete len:666 (-) Transcript_25958:271-2268(-)
MSLGTAALQLARGPRVPLSPMCRGDSACLQPECDGRAAEVGLPDAAAVAVLSSPATGWTTRGPLARLVWANKWGSSWGTTRVVHADRALSAALAPMSHCKWCHLALPHTLSPPSAQPAFPVYLDTIRSYQMAVSTMGFGIPTVHWDLMGAPQSSDDNGGRKSTAGPKSVSCLQTRRVRRGVQASGDDAPRPSPARAFRPHTSSLGASAFPSASSSAVVGASFGSPPLGSPLLLLASTTAVNSVTWSLDLKRTAYVPSLASSCLAGSPSSSPGAAALMTANVTPFPPSMSATLMPGQRLALSSRRRLPRCRITKRACPEAARFIRTSPLPRSFHVLASVNSYSVASAAKPTVSSSSPVICFSSDSTEAAGALAAPPSAGAADASAVEPKMLAGAAAAEPNTLAMGGERLASPPSVAAAAEAKEKAAAGAEAEAGASAAGDASAASPAGAKVAAGAEAPARPPLGLEAAAAAKEEVKPEAELLAAAANAKGLVLAAAPNEPKSGAVEGAVEGAAAVPSPPAAGLGAPKRETPEKGLAPGASAPTALRFTDTILRDFSTSSDALANGPLGSSSPLPASGSSWLIWRSLPRFFAGGSPPSMWPSVRPACVHKCSVVAGAAGRSGYWLAGGGCYKLGSTAPGEFCCVSASSPVLKLLRRDSGQSLLCEYL